MHGGVTKDQRLQTTHHRTSSQPNRVDPDLQATAQGERGGTAHAEGAERAMLPSQVPAY